MNARARCLARPALAPLLAVVLLLGLLAKQEQPASLARIVDHRITVSDSEALISPGHPGTIRSLAAASRSDRAPAAQPDLFDLSDAASQIQITYATSGVDGRPHLDYTDRRLQRSYVGAAIRVLRSEIGTLVSVTLEQVPDLHTITLTLLLPAINLQGTRATIGTEAILTTQRTSIGGPALVQGTLQTYRVLRLQGTARLVEF
jgi:hypothetical protein